MIITIPIKTPSINHLYGQNGFRKYLKPEAKELRENIKKIVKAINPEDLKNKKLKVVVEVYEDWETQKGEVKKKDIGNREKFLIDSVFEALEIDDKFIYELTMRKIQSEKEFSIIKIKEIIK